MSKLHSCQGLQNFWFYIKCLDIDLCLTAKITVCLFALLLCVPVNSHGQVETLAVERNVKQ